MHTTPRQMTLGSALFIVGLTLALNASAQSGDAKHGPAAGDGMQQMSGMMNDNAKQMMEMSGDLSKGNVNAGQQKQMAERMRMMAGMMERMSGMMGKGMSMDADMQKQMGDMHKQMEQMHHSADHKH